MLFSTKTDWNYAIKFMLFACMGAGANWVLATAIAQEIPYFEDHAPEGLCIATYMNVFTACSIIPTLCYLYAKSMGYTISYSKSVPALLYTSCISAFLSSAVYNITVERTSFFLFVCCFVSGSVGSLSTVIMNPFMTQYENNYISAARFGGSGGILLAAIVASIQQPGASNMNFNTAIYLCIFGVLFIFPILAYYYITGNSIGEKEPRSMGEEGLAAKVYGEVVETGGLALIHMSTEGQDSMCSTKHITQNPLIEESCSSSSSVVDETVVKSAHTNHHYTSTTAVSAWYHETVVRGWICEYFLTWYDPTLLTRYPWVPKVVPFMLTIGWINFNTWGMLSALMPFAVEYATTSSGSSEENLAIAYEISAVCLLMGDYTTTLFKLPFDKAIGVFTVFSFVIYLAATDILHDLFQTAVSAPLIIIIYCLGRYLEAHIVTSTYRVVATEFSIEDRELASQAVGACDQMSTVFGAVLSTIVVVLTADC